MIPFSILFRFLILFVGIALVPASVGYIFADKLGAAIGGGLVAVWACIELTRSERRLRGVLAPSTIEIADEKVFAIEDPSSHLFATQALFSLRPTLWITRGALSLLEPEEISSILRSLRVVTRSGGFRYETFLTAILTRLTAKIPSGFRDILFFREKRTKSILIRESARALFWTSSVLLLEAFYLRRTSRAPWAPEEILRKLEAESRRCVPRLPAALSSLSAVPPWPDAFITLGRPCLLPATAVNLKA